MNYDQISVDNFHAFVREFHLYHIIKQCMLIIIHVVHIFLFQVIPMWNLGIQQQS